MIIQMINNGTVGTFQAQYSYGGSSIIIDMFSSSKINK